MLNEEVREIARVVAWTVSSIVPVILVIGLISYPIKMQMCETRWPAQMEPQYELFIGCTVLWKEQRVPAENVRLIQED